MHWFIEELGALTAAENCCHTLHNTYTLRGAQIRDPHAWSQYLERDDRALGRQGRGAVRHAPLAGLGQRPCRRPAEQGPRRLRLHQRRDAAPGQPRLHARSEIAELVELPDVARPPLGAARLLRHAQPQRQGDVRQVPRLVRRQPGDTCTRCRPRTAPRRYVEFMGGADAVLEKARAAYEHGEYRWVAEVVNHVVFAEPGEHRGARAAGRRARAARLPVRGRHLAQPLPHRRAGAAPRHADVKLPFDGRRPGHDQGDEPGPVLQLPRRAAQRVEGGHGADRAQLGRSPTPASRSSCSSPTARSATSSGAPRRTPTRRSR